MGLVTFGDRVTVDLEPTRDFQGFSALFGQISQLQPATLLFDGIVRSVEVLQKFVREHRDQLAPECRLRILCLSDGEDSGSTRTAEQALSALLSANVILDAVPIEGSHARMRALANASGGLCFRVDSFEEGISLFEREAVLSLRHRRPTVVPPSAGKKIEQLVDACPYSVGPQICEPPLLRATLAQKHHEQQQQQHLSAERTKRLMNELRDLLENPVAGFEILSEELTFWAIRWTGDGPYKGGTFVLYADLSRYPDLPPEVRFFTPIFHCNVNNDGRICIDELSAQSWSSAEISMRKILESIAKILVSPNAFAAIDSVKGALYRENKELYLARASDSAKESLKK